jgi:hypothetical protein
MSMIFPGMDPYLESPELHNSLIVYIRDALQPLLRPNYIAALEERVFVEGPPEREFIPDVLVKRRRDEPHGTAAVIEADAPVEVVSELEIHESYLTILDRQTRRVVTVLEVLSPTNKYAGPGRDSYVAKQREVLASQTHLVEIDLLRRGPHVLAIPEWLAQERVTYEYLVCVNRAEGRRNHYQLYPRRLRERLPRIRVPLAGNDPDVVLDVQAILAHAYEAGSYRDLLAYDRPCQPPLSPEDQAWADERIREALAGS